MSKKKPSDPAPYDWPTFDSIGQAAGATGIPRSILTKAKDDGCLAFKGTRVLFGDFLVWYFSRDHVVNVEEEKLLKAKRIRAEELAKQASLATKKIADELVSKSEARHSLVRYAAALRTKLVDLPRRTALQHSLLKEPAEHEECSMAAIRTVLGELHKHEWGDMKCAECGKEIK